MVNLLELPAELLNNALSYLQADALVAFGRTSSQAHKFINIANSTLWKNTFLHTYDDPLPWVTRVPALSKRADQAAKPVDGWDYFFHLRQRTIITRLITGQELNMKDDHTEAVRTILSIIETARTSGCSLNLQVLAVLSERGQRNLDHIIHARQMEVLRRIPSEGIPTNRPITRSTMHVVEQPDIAARLHVLYGLTTMEKDAPRLRGIARRLVYDWSLTGPKTDHGPFKLDGSGEVNWQLLEAACSTISRNFSKCADGRIIIPQGFRYSVPYRTLPDPNIPGDWAGVQGIFVGTYAFLDYADLHFFNIGQRNGQRTSLEDEREACGDLMSLELKLDPSLESDPVLKTKIPICNDLPMLYFSGVSIGFDGAYRPPIGVRGTTSLLPGGREVRWRFLITYGGEDQWQLEGVQAGGPRSGGIYGIWSHVGHTPHGPTGPFCYFPSELCKRFV